MKKVFTLVAVVAMLATMTGTALGQDDSGDAPEVVELHNADYGVGAIWAKGSGTAELEATFGGVAMRVNGDVTITGGINIAVIDGERSSPDEVRIQGFDGVIYVQGTDMLISLNGEIGLHGIGQGHAEFTGQGMWKTLHRRGLWRGTVASDIDG